MNWGAMAVGGISGLGTGIVLAVPVVAATGAETFTGQALLILTGFIAQGVAGYVAGRFAGRSEPLNGGLAALAIYVIAAAISIASGSEPAVLTLVLSGVVALVLGSAGGVLAAGRRRPARGN